MKYIYILLFLSPFFVRGQGNYVKTTVYKDSTKISIASPTTRQAVQKATYFDGLGRPLQEVSAGQSSLGKSIVTHMEYDKMGKQPFEYLPYASDTESGVAFQQNAKSAAAAFYQRAENGNTSYAFSLKSDDGSPLQRLSDVYSPGDSWIGSSNRQLSFQYITNSDGEIRQFKSLAQPLANGCYPEMLSSHGNYPASQLYVKLTSDENRNQTVEFNDGTGKLIMKRQISESGNHDTYYVYDQFGNLSFVMPPLSDLSGSPQDLDGVCYQYRYDTRNRLVEKKLPGKQWEFIIYDKLDRVVATGPALSPFSNLVSNGGWNITKYDVFGRPIITGWLATVSNSATRNTIQRTLNGYTESFRISETKSATDIVVNNVSFRYTNTSWPGTFHVLSVNYFDDYSFPGAPQVIPSAVLPDQSQPVYYNNIKKPKGLSTGSWTRVLETTADARAELSYILYDQKSNPVRVHSKNYLGGYTQADSKFNFTGKVLHMVTEQKRLNGDAALTVREEFSYNDQNLLLMHTHQVNGGAVEMLSTSKYDDFGRLKKKSVGRSEASPMQQVDYSYNIRGWLTGINTAPADSADPADLFVFEIRYDNPETAQPLFNGNISETYWKSASDMVKRKYNYSYDKLNRLTGASYLKYEQNYQATHAYNEAVEYDKNGNISHLWRNGNNDGPVGLEIDNLAYSYSTEFPNRLLKVADDSQDPVGFKDGTNDGDDYTYDQSGNMTSDLNKGILSITYNHLNLPVKITFGNGIDRIEYLYDGTGKKLKKTVTYSELQVQGSEVIKAMDYLGGFHYDDAVLKFFPTAEGYVDHTAGQFNYVYNYADHLGNVRLSYGRNPVTGAIKILEENHYYPFGLKHANYNIDRLAYQKQESGVVLRAAPVSPSVVFNYDYKYQGQERQDELGLNWDSFKWRNYDYAIGRFMNIDPLAEEYEDYTPYQFASNQPVHANEVEGLENAHDLNKRIQTKESRTTVNDAISKNTQMSRTVERALSVPSQNQAVTRQQPMLSQGSTPEQSKANAAKAAGIARAKNVVSNHDNLGSPHTQNSVMVGAGYGALDVATGEVVGKVIGGVSKFVGSKSANVVDDIATSSNMATTSPDFVVTSGGDVIPIPTGAAGPTAPMRGSGMVYQGGSGGPGMNSRTTGVRIMDANANQGARVNYMNNDIPTAQTVNPATGRTISNKDPAGHLPINNN